MFRLADSGIVYEYAGEMLRVVPWGRDSVRVQASIFGEPENTSYALGETAPQIEGESFAELRPSGALLRNGKITVELSGENAECHLCIRRSDTGKVLLEEYRACRALKLKARNYRTIAGAQAMEAEVLFAADPDEKLFGMGQYQQSVLDWKGCILELAHRNSQISIPFVLSSKGYGFLWHNPAIGRAVFGNNMTVWSVESCRQIDYWVTAADTPKEIIGRYAEATGKPPVMPEYGLGFWQSKLRYWNQEQLLAVAREYKKRGIPLDVVVCDYFHWPRLGDFRFDEEFFPDPVKMAGELEAMGIRLMVSVWPEVALDSENWEEMNQRGLLVRTERGVQIQKSFGGYSTYFDPSNPKARAFVWEKCRKNYLDKGIRLFWLDDAEPNYDKLDFEHYRLSEGPNLQVGNLFPKYYAQTFYDGLRESGEQEILNLVRCAWAGSQKFGTLIWSGDIHSTFEDFRKQIKAGINMGICGIPWWTTDIGGFTGGDPNDPAFRELLIRWFEWGTFLPVMRLHGDRTPSKALYRKDGSSALFTGADNEIWSFGEEAYGILKKYISVREQLRPYLRKLMDEAHRSGTPLIRAMFLEFPDDAECWKLDDQYMFGDALLVAPIVQANAEERWVYFPKGVQWFNFFTGEAVENGRQKVHAGLGEIPVYVRGDKRENLD